MLHSALSPLMIDKLFNDNMPTVNFILSALNIGNSLVPSPLKEILQDVYDRQKYLYTYLPHTPTYQQEIELTINQENKTDKYDNCITVLAIRAIRKNIKLVQSARPLNFNEAFGSQSLMLPEAQSRKKTLEMNLEHVAKWPTFSVINNKVLKHMKPSQQDTFVIDYVLFTLLNLIALYATNLDLDKSIDISKVEKLQQLHLKLLYNYLKMNYPERAHNLLASGISAISKAQEASQILQNNA